jgi:antitoxin (DNA-binding transcriptional repressor) of toxin-antitoxin stability system
MSSLAAAIKQNPLLGDFLDLVVREQYRLFHQTLSKQAWEDYMSTTVTIEEAQAHLAELVSKLTPGEEIVITENDQPVAKLTGQHAPARQPRQPGSAKGKLIILADDEEHLEDFKEYMP